MQKKETKKYQVTSIVGEKLKGLVKKEVAATGVREGEIVRQSLTDRYQRGANESEITLNLILLTQQLQEAKANMQPEDYEAMSQYINNIMIHRGGNRDVDF